jgi:hypothetical protein
MDHRTRVEENTGMKRIEAAAMSIDALAINDRTSSAKSSNHLAGNPEITTAASSSKRKFITRYSSVYNCNFDNSLAS